MTYFLSAVRVKSIKTDFQFILDFDFNRGYPFNIVIKFIHKKKKNFPPRFNFLECFFMVPLQIPARFGFLAYHRLKHAQDASRLHNAIRHDSKVSTYQK